MSSTSPLIVDLVGTMIYLQAHEVFHTTNGKWLVNVRPGVGALIEDADLIAQLDELDATIALVRFEIPGADMFRVLVDDGRY